MNGNNNQEEGEWVVVHHNSWDKGGCPRFPRPDGGGLHHSSPIGGRVPDRAAVVAAAEVGLARRRDEQDANNPKGKKWTQEAYARDLKHFETDRMYDYGPPRAKLVLHWGRSRRPSPNST